jgi:hypothetical protein
MKHMNKKIIVAVNAIVLVILLSSITVISSPISKSKTEEMITVTVTDMLSDTRSEHAISKEVFFELFQPMEKPISNEELSDFYQHELGVLTDNGMISSETNTRIMHNLYCMEKDTLYSQKPTGALFDVVNVFNGLFFALKGEKVNSFFDMPVFQFPFFKDNITALFSGFSKYAGNGFIFTLGTLGFQYSYDYNPDVYEFPYFAEVSGSIIGFTGVLLETEVGDTFGEQYEGFYSIGIGMNIFTLWNTQ